MMRSAIRSAYRLALSGRNSRVIFQTEHDRREFVEMGLVDRDRSVVIRGAGVDLNVFTPASEPSAPMVILLAARLLWNKGVADLIEAGVQLRREGHVFRIVLVGVPDTDNPQAVPQAQLEEWQRAGLAEWWGRRDDMASVIQQAAVVVLPTYYGEGVPKILLEAAACGRPIVASDLPGCRDVVEDGINGFIVPARDSSLLAAAIGRLLLDPALRHRMGQAGRLRVSREFGDQLVVAQTLNVYRDLLQSRGLVKEARALSRA
jgi:glycosyltransferase involved in cell wall biosynthesis